jgi:voltage-gated potassium channel
MLLGYSIIAVPTGIITAEIRQAARPNPPASSRQECPVCGERDHLARARHCHRCGGRLATADQGSSATV